MKGAGVTVGIGVGPAGGEKVAVGPGEGVVVGTNETTWPHPVRRTTADRIQAARKVIFALNLCLQRIFLHIGFSRRGTIGL